MRPSPYFSQSLASLFLLLPSITTATSIDCSHIRADKKDFNFEALDGSHSVWTMDDHKPSSTNTTFTVSLCQPLKKPKGVPKNDYCENGSRVCAIQTLVKKGADVEPVVERAIPIAGDFRLSRGGDLNPIWSIFKASSDSEGEKEGLRLEMHGGQYTENGEKQTHEAVIEFFCPENGKNGKDDEKTEKREDDDDDGKDEKQDTSGEEQDDGKGGKLKYISWKKEEDDITVLRLEWTTKYACEGASGSGSSSSGHWGFFTWLIIILFMGVAAYLIFGSWLNYNRYSARGWDMIPHSDTIQDLPYLLKDWVRKIINTVQGGGSRGGYSAV